MNPTTPGEQVGSGCGVQLESPAWLSGCSQGREGKGKRENVHSSELRGGLRAQSPRAPRRASWGPLNVREPEGLLARLPRWQEITQL